MRGLALLTGCWRRLRESAIMAFQLIGILVIGQADIAILTVRYPATVVAFQLRSISPSVLEKNDLSSLAQRMVHGSLLCLWGPL